jgi:hypothetical protein
MPNDVLDHVRRPDGRRRPVTLTFILFCALGLARLSVT